MASHKFRAIWLPVLAVGCFISCTKDSLDIPAGRDNAVTITAVAQELAPKQVRTRSAIDKSDEERQIKTLHLFLFDSDGNYLEPKTGDGHDHPFVGYQMLPYYESSIRIDWEGFADNALASSATVYAVANVEEGTFPLDANGRPTNLGLNGNTPLRDLENFMYRPLNSETLLALPASGMPMVGHADGVNLTQPKGTQTIYLKALMARIDVSIKLAPNQTGGTQQRPLPRLRLTGYEMRNMPTAVRFLPPDPGTETDLGNDGQGNPLYTKSISRQVTGDEIISADNGSYDFHCYVFENVRQTQPYEYPPNVVPEDMQRYKPLLADPDRATAFIFRGLYEDFVGTTYEAEYTLYLGANHTDDFEVRRNCHYKNTIAIKGITQVGDTPGLTIFDARVNVAQTNNYFISYLYNDDMDAHFDVRPIDVYLMAENSPSMQVEILGSPDWVRFEKVDAATMQAANWKAGTGKRPYFTTDLLTATLGSEQNRRTTLGHRDRIYLYTDENLTDSERSVTLRFTYTEGGVAKGSEEITFVQRKLLPIEILNNDHTAVQQTLYVELVEEYHDYTDPLETLHDQDASQGFTYGPSIEIGRIGNAFSSWSYNNYYEGDVTTSRLISAYSQASLTLNETPRSAAEYCYNKNKRSSSGAVTSVKWFLPDIRQLEYIVQALYAAGDKHTADYFYWSSTTGRRTEYLGGFIPWDREATDNACATKCVVNHDGTTGYCQSGEDYVFTGRTGTGGFTPRGERLHVRAVRIDKNK